MPVASGMARWYRTTHKRTGTPEIGSARVLELLVFSARATAVSQQDDHMHTSWDVSVCICTYNRCQTLRSALESVLGQETNDVRFEVIVVDNNSTDQTKQVVDSFVRRGQSNLRYSSEGHRVPPARHELLAKPGIDAALDARRHTRATRICRRQHARGTSLTSRHQQSAQTIRRTARQLGRNARACSRMAARRLCTRCAPPLLPDWCTEARSPQASPGGARQQT
jgi:hypothetical protein